MGRIRTVKPELAAHEGLFDLERETQLPVRFAWCMLFTVCDREGRFQWRPRTLKVQILPHDEIDFSRVLDAWLTRGFIVKYRVGDEWFGWVPTFTRHQVINNRESESILPTPEEADEAIDNRNQPHGDACGTREGRVDDASGTRAVHAQAEGKGREGKGREDTLVPGGTRDGANSETPKKRNGLASDLEQQIIAAYHEELPELPRVLVWGKARHAALSARVDEGKKRGKPADTVDYWRSVFRKVSRSDFLMGRKGDWSACDLEWILKPANFVKVIEGKYDNRGGTNGRSR